MGSLSRKLRSIGDNRATKGICHWCPGCDAPHAIWTERGEGSSRPIWSYDGNAEAPTCSPSVRISDNAGTTCHYFLKAGQIEFCGDCRHELAGKTVPLPDWPYAEGEYGGV